MIMLALSPTTSIMQFPSISAKFEKSEDMDDSGFFDDFNSYYEVKNVNEAAQKECDNYMKIAKDIGIQLTQMCDAFDREFMNPTPVYHKTWLDNILEFLCF